MAKKTKLNAGRTQASGSSLGTIDLSDVDDLFGDDPAMPKGKSPVTEFKTGLKAGFLEKMKTKNIVRSFLRSAAPDGYARMFGTYDDVMRGVTEVKDTIERTHASDLDYLGRKTQDLLPKLKDKIPNSLYERMQEGLSNKLEKYRYEMEAGRDQMAIRRQAMQDADEDTIKAALDQNTLIQKDIFQRTERATMARSASDKIERGIRDRIAGARFDFMSKAMGVAVDNLSRVASYAEQIDYGFKKKSLELQFRTYMGIRDLLKVNEANLDLQNKGFAALVRNTGIPDHKKASIKDLVQLNLSNRASTGLADTVVQTLPSFLGGFAPELQKRATNKAGAMVSSLARGMQTGEGMSGFWDQRYNIAGQMIGDQAGSFARNTVLPILGRKARPHMEKLSNKMGGRHNQASYLLDNMPAYMQEYVNNYQNTYGARGVLRNMIAPFTPQFHLNDRVESGSYQTIDQQAGFNQLSQRSLVEIIPGYLARQLQELRMIRTGKDDVEREVFDITTGKFSDEAGANKRLSRRIVGGSTIRGVSGTINDALNKYDPEGKLTPQARQALAERLLRDASTNKRFDPGAYARKGGYGDEVGDDTRAELEGFFKSKFDLDERGAMRDTSNNHQLREEFSKAFLDIRSISRDPIKEITRLINSGNTESLRMMGIIVTEQGIDRINYNEIWKLMRGGVTDTNEDLGGTPGPSGDPNDPNFSGPRYPGAMGARAKNTLVSIRNKGLKLTPLKDQFGKFNSGLSQDLYSRLPGAAKFSGFGQTLNGFQQSATEFTIGSRDHIMDVFSKHNPGEVLIKAADIVQGQLVDVNTKKIITSVADITGQVVNMDGGTVVTASEAAQGLYSQKGELLAKADGALNQMRAKANNVVNQLQDNFAAQAANDDNTDWCIPGDPEPVILARDLTNGKYFDAVTKDQVFSMTDIKGTLTDAFGTTVVTTQELAKGLRSKTDGREWKPTSLAGKYAKGSLSYLNMVRGTTTQVVWRGLKTVGKLALGAAAKLYNVLGPKDRDAYRDGEQEPVLSKRKLRNGDYYNANGEPITSFYRHYSAIYDAQGELILDTNDLKSLTNMDGSKHQLAKNQTLWGKTGGRLMKKLRSGYVKASKAYWKGLGRLTGKAAGWVGRKIGSPFLKGANNIAGRMTKQIDYSTLETPTDQLLARILETLQESMPEQYTKGSWQEKAARAKDALLGGDKTTAAKAGEKNGLFGGLGGGLKSLFDKLRGKDKDEDDEDGWFDDGPDVDIDINGGDRDGKRGRRGRPRSRKGRLSRIMRAGRGGLLGRGALGAAKQGLMGRAAMFGLGRLAMGAGTALAGLVSAPVLLGVGAAVAVGAGAYWLYNRNAKTSGDFRELRLLQYGVTSTGDQLKVLELEAQLAAKTGRGSNPTVDLRSVGIKEVLNIMGLDVDEPKAVMRFATWFEQRGKPIMTAYLAGLSKIGKGDVAIGDIDEKVPDELKGMLLETVKFGYGGDTPYQYRESAVGDEEPMEDTIPAIAEKFEELAKKYKVSKEQAASAKDKAFKETAKAATTEVGVQAVGKKAIAATVNPQGTVTPLDPKKRTAITTPGTRASLGGSLLLAAPMRSTKLTELQAIRMRAYGLESLSTTDVQALLAFEQQFISGVKVSGSDADYTGDSGLLLHEISGLFAVNQDNLEQRQRFYNWALDRFIPTARAFILALRTANSGVPLSSFESKLKSSELVGIANAIIGAKNTDGQAIWGVDSFFEIKGSLADLQKLAQADLALLKKKAESDMLDSPTQTKGDQTAAGAGAKTGKSFAAGIIDNVKSAISSVREFGGRVADYVGSKVSSVGQAASDFKANVAYKLGAAGEVSAMGRVYGSITKGNGGQWEKIPYPKRNKSLVHARPTLEAIAEMVGIPVHLLHIFCQMESNYDYTVKAKTSSATGWFQFINSTWDGMLRMHGATYGIPADDAQRSLRLDPRINGLMGACFLKDNYAYLLKRLGRHPTDVDLYLAHFMGPGGAAKFLTRDQNTLGATVFPEQAAANRSIFYHTSGQARTLGEIYKLFDAKIAKYRSSLSADGGMTAGSSVTEQEAGKTMTPEEIAEEQAKVAQKVANGDRRWEDGSESTAGANAVAQATAYSASKAGAKVAPVGVFPLTQPAGGAAPQVGPTAPSDSGADSVEQQHQAISTVAAARDQTRARQVQREAAKEQMLSDIQAQQLAVQTEMLANLKRLVELSEAKTLPIEQAQKGDVRTNGIASASRTTGRAAGSQPLPVSLS